MSTPTSSLSIDIPPTSPAPSSSPSSSNRQSSPVLPTAPSSASSPSDIERELSSVRSIRRRSGSVGGHVGEFDPDLPIAMTPVQSTLESADGIHPSSHQPGSTEGSDESEGDTLSSLWVPATLHPELAPGEFRAFLKEHAHAHAQQSEASSSTSAPGLSHSLSASRSAPSITPSSPFDNSGLQPSNSGSLGRKRSMLSRQYTPRAGDGVENEPPLPGNLHRSRSNRTSIYSSSQGADAESGVTLVDLQMLEELADEAAKSDDPSKLRSMLKRSWSINSQKSSIDSIDGVAFDENDAPIVALRPGAPSLMRRTARTKIRKAGMEGGENRFGPSRRGRTAHLVGDNALTFEDQTLPAPMPIFLDDPPRMPAASSDPSSEDAHATSSDRPISTASSLDDTFYDAYMDPSRLSLTSESSISHDSTARVESPSPPSQPYPDLPSLRIDDAEPSIADEPTTPTQQSVSPSFTTAPSLSRSEPDSSPIIVPEPEQPAPASPALSPSLVEHSTTQPPRAPSPDPSIASTTSTQSSQRPPLIERASSPVHTLSAPQHSGVAGGAKMERTDSSSSSISSSSGAKKEKKGGLFSRNKGDKDKKDKSKSGSDKEKSSSVFGSLFGSKKKDKDDKPSQVTSDQGRLVATALLGKTAKSPIKDNFGTGPSSSTTSGPFSNFARYPIHVERAVYRLSHIKLANPRRPLYEQVLISNLMFWYLSVINRTQNGPAGVKEKEKADREKEKEKEKGEKDAADLAAAEKANSGKPKEGEDAEIAGAEKAKASAGKGTPPGGRPNPYLDGTAAAAAASITPPAQKRTSLTREDPRGAGRSGGGRSAESLAVRTPQYGAQNAQIEMERMMPGGGGGGPPQSRGGGEQHRERESRPPPPSQNQPRPNPSQQLQQQSHSHPPSGYNNAQPPPQQQQPPHRVVSAGREPDRRRSPPPSQSRYGPNSPNTGPAPLLPTSHSHGPHASHDPRSYPTGGGPSRSLSPNPPFPSSQSHPQSHPQPHSPSSIAAGSQGPNMRRAASDHVGGGPPHPHHHQQPHQAPHPPHPPGTQPMRKGSSESGPPSRGPQPGQVFSHPNGAMPGQVFRHPGGGLPNGGPPGAVRPGEVFNPALVPQLGQIFQHPGYQRPPPGPPLHASQQQYPNPQQQHRLPPGLSPQQLQAYYVQHPHLQPHPSHNSHSNPYPPQGGGPPFPGQQRGPPPPQSSSRSPHDSRQGGPPPPQQGYPPQGYRPQQQQQPNSQQHHPDSRQQMPRSRSGEGGGQPQERERVR